MRQASSAAIGYRFPVGEAAAVALAAGGAAVSLPATLVLKVNDGPPPPSCADGNPLVDFYGCRDGR